MNGRFGCRTTSSATDGAPRLMQILRAPATSSSLAGRGGDAPQNVGDRRTTRARPSARPTCEQARPRHPGGLARNMGMRGWLHIIEQQAKDVVLNGDENGLARVGPTDAQALPRSRPVGLPPGRARADPAKRSVTRWPCGGMVSVIDEPTGCDELVFGHDHPGARLQQARRAGESGRPPRSPGPWRKTLLRTDSEPTTQAQDHATSSRLVSSGAIQSSGAPTRARTWDLRIKSP